MIALDSPAEMARKMDEMFEEWKQLSHAERLQCIVDAGIIDAQGKLAPQYNRTMESEAAEDAALASAAK